MTLDERINIADKRGNLVIDRGIHYFKFPNTNQIWCECIDKTITQAVILPGTYGIVEGGFNNSSLKKLQLTRDLRVIGDGAFENCFGLTVVTFPPMLEHLGNRAFAHTSLKSVKIPKSVTFMGEKAFKGCTKLQEVFVGHGIEVLRNKTFEGCTNLETVNVSNRLKTVWDNCFSGCPKLGDLSLPPNVRTIRE